MKREKKIKIIIGFSTLFLIIESLMYDKYCIYSINKWCSLSRGFSDILEPIFWLSIGLFTIIILTFFISDIIFKKWLKFALIWFGITAVLIVISPTTGGGTLGLSSDKESVSILMSKLFVVISIIIFVWMTIKEKKNS